MKSEIIELILAGESDYLELKASIRDLQLLAKLIGSFANAQGGKIVVGVKEPQKLIGVDEVIMRRVYEAARKRLVPEPKN